MLSQTLLRILVALAIYGGTRVDGVAPHYAAGVMERVAARRGMAVVDCMVSSPTEPLGTWLVVYGAATDRAMRCRVSDVSAPQDRARHLRMGRVVELGFRAAQRLCGTTDGPPAACPVVVVRYG